MAIDHSPLASLGLANDDFQVDELPLYRPSGTGEHHYLLVQKRNCTTPLLIKALAACCGVSERDIGHAGRKDRHGLTTQWISIHGGDISKLDELYLELPHDADVVITEHTQHGNKLRPGHLRGNRFTLRLTDIIDFPSLQQHIAQCVETGIPNYYGHQRFGRDQHNLNLARQLIAGNKSLRRNDQRLRYASDAAQAAICDAIIAGRLAEDRLRRAVVGDVVQLPNGANFVATEAELADINRRLAAHELVCTAPLPGTHCVAANDIGAADEARWSAELAIPWEAFAKSGRLRSRGGRRAATMHFLEAPHLEASTADGDQAILRFALAAGNYASTAAAAWDIVWQRAST